MMDKFFNFLQSTGLISYLSYGSIALLVAFAGWTGYQTYERLQLPDVLPTQAQPFVPPPKPSRTLAQMLQDTRIFVEEDLSKLPTTVGLTITGIFFSAKSGDSRVLVSSSGQAAQSYGVWESVSGGQSVYKISSNKVIFMQDGDLSQSSFSFPGIDFSAQRPKGLF
jgi:hypothetical protein